MNHDLAKVLFKSHYDQPWRVFHSWRHIDHGLEALQEFIYAKELDEADTEIRKIVRQHRDLLYIAWYMHDLVYVPKHEGNEQASADLVPYYAPMLIPNIDLKGIQTISRLIMCTKDHKVVDRLFPGTPVSKELEALSKVMIDVDLIGFAKYHPMTSLWVREEFESVLVQIKDEDGLDDFDRKWRMGQSDFLTGLLLRDSLYQTGYFKSNYQQEALANIRAEVDSYK